MSDGGHDILQQYWIELASEYKVLKEVQIRHEKMLDTLTIKSDNNSLHTITIDEHFKAYIRTVTDLVVKLDNMYVLIERLKDDIHEIHIDLENIDGNRTRCTDKFTDITTDVDEVSEKYLKVQKILTALYTRIQTIETGLVEITTSLKTLNESTKPIKKTYDGIAGFSGTVKWIFGIVAAIITFLGGLKALGVF